MKKKKLANQRTVALRLTIPADVHKRLKIAAVLAEKTIAQTAINTLDKYLPKIK